MHTNPFLNIHQHRNLLRIQFDMMRHLYPICRDVDILDPIYKVDAVAQFSLKCTITVFKISAKEPEKKKNHIPATVRRRRLRPLRLLRILLILAMLVPFFL